VLSAYENKMKGSADVYTIDPVAYSARVFNVGPYTERRDDTLPKCGRFGSGRVGAFAAKHS